jgi:hypothetical protein
MWQWLGAPELGLCKRPEGLPGVTEDLIESFPMSIVRCQTCAVTSNQGVFICLSRGVAMGFPMGFQRTTIVL